MSSIIPTIQQGTGLQRQVISPVYLTGNGPNGLPKAISVDVDGKLVVSGSAGGGGSGGSITFSSPQSVRLSNGSAWQNAALEDGNLASILAKLPTVGTAGTPSANFISVQGNSSMTPLLVSGSSAIGATPVLNPVSVSGVDGGGLKRHFLTDTAGRLNVISGDGTNNISINTTLADGSSISLNRLRTTSVGMYYNGTTIDLIRGANGSINVNTPSAIEITYPTIVTPPVSNLLSAAGTVQAKITPGGVYTFCVAIDNATLGATANTLTSCTTVAFNGSNLNAAKVVGYTGTSPQVGQLLSGTGISPGSYVVSVSAGVSFTMNLPATASGTVTLNITAGSFAGTFQSSADGVSWNNISVIPKTYSCDQNGTSAFVTAGLWQYSASATDNFLRFNLTSVSTTGVLGNLSAAPRLRFNIDAFDRNASRVNMPYVSYVAATAATFPTGIPIIMPVDCDGLSEIAFDLNVITGTSQVITWRQSNDENGVLFQGLTATTTQVAQNSAAITATAAGVYRLAPAARFFYASLTAGTAITAATIGGVIAKVGVQPAIQAVHLTTNNAPINIGQVGGNNTVTGGLNGTLAVGGAAAHSAASTTNPITAGGRVVPTTAATAEATLVAGDVSHVPISTGYQIIQKQFGTSELDWSGIHNLTPTVWASTATLTQVRAASGTANIRTYISSLQLATDALGGATSLWLLDGAVAISSATVATPGVFTSGTHDFKIGDAIILQGIATLAVTGVSANQIVYVVTIPSTTTFTVALTPGGTGVQVTASGTATAYRILKQIRLQTTALPVTAIPLPSPIRTAPNVALSLLASATQTGTVYVDSQGYYGF